MRISDCSSDVCSSDLKFGAGADLVKWHNGFLESLELPAGWQPNKIVSSLVLHQVPLRKKQAILETIESLLVPGGTVLIADYMKQDSPLMRSQIGRASCRERVCQYV